ncbi:MAG: cytochrome c biogenesis protein CcsA [Phycisphaerae bacterium]|nr:cytochrome c biogenesis protein CcsA [Phycisphaerae bacterium]
MTSLFLPAVLADLPIAPTPGQLGWVLLALVLLSIGLGMSWAGFVERNPRLRRVGRGLALAGLLIDLALILWRNMVGRRACPIQDNFDSVLLFVVLLGGVLFYLVMIYRRPMLPEAGPRRSVIDVVLLPLMIAMQGMAVAIYFGGYRNFKFTDLWQQLHLAFLLTATLLSAAAAVGAIMYLLMNRALRRKKTESLLGGLPSLERLETLMQHAVLWVFILLTLSAVIGMLLRAGVGVTGGPVHVSLAKLSLAVASWFVYGVLLAIRFVPRYRGRSVAWLCMFGFGLMLATYVVVQWQRTAGG